MPNVYPPSDTETIFEATKDGSPFDLDVNNVTRVRLYLCSKPPCKQTDFIDSNDGDITWVGDKVTLFLGHLEVPKGRYTGIIKFYDSSTPLGFLIDTIPITIVCNDPTL